MAALITRPVPTRHWQSYGDDPLPSGEEAIGDRCGKERMLNETHAVQREKICPLLC